MKDIVIPAVIFTVLMLALAIKPADTVFIIMISLGILGTVTALCYGTLWLIFKDDEEGS